MGIGGSIFLIALGAIIAFGVTNQTLGPLDLNVIGYVLMLAGLVGLVLTLWFWNTRKRRVVAGPIAQHPHAVQSEETVTETRYSQDPPPGRRG